MATEETAWTLCSERLPENAVYSDLFWVKYNQHSVCVSPHRFEYGYWLTLNGNRQYNPVYAWCRALPPPAEDD